MKGSKMNDYERKDYYTYSRYQPFYSKEKMYYYNCKCGYDFFAPDATRFFRSKFATVLHGKSPANWNIFITSEQFDSRSPRLYTVRQMLMDGSTQHLSAFQQFSTLKQARKFAEDYIKANESA